MDGFSKVQQAGPCAMVCSCICGLAMCGGWITFMVYLGKYAYSNPNNAAVYGVANSVEGLWATSEAATAAGAVDISDVHGHFVAWFTWGLWQQLLPLMTAVVMGLSMLLSPTLGSCLGGLGMCGVSCGGLAWWITGMVWRFNAAGKFATGDVFAQDYTGEDYQADWIALYPNLNQVQSGNFMGVYYLITWILMGISCGCSLLAAIGMCIAAMCCK